MTYKGEIEQLFIVVFVANTLSSVTIVSVYISSLQNCYIYLDIAWFYPRLLSYRKTDWQMLIVEYFCILMTIDDLSP